MSGLGHAWTHLWYGPVDRLRLWCLEKTILVVLALDCWMLMAERGGRYGAHPECSLLASPRSEDGACDTDVQTLGKADVLAHTSLMDGMYTI